MLKTPSAMDGNESLANAKPNPKSGDSGCLAQEIANGYAIKRGLLPTPISSEIAHPARVKEQINKDRTSLREREKGEAGPNGLTDFLMFNGLIPTVVTQGLKYCNEKGQSVFVKAEMLPTPKAQDERHALHDRGRSNLGEEIAERYGDGSSLGSQLNPLFVAEMMGFPPDWTVLPFLAGDEKASKPTATQ